MSGPSLKCMPVESYYGRGPPEGGTAVQLVEPLPGVEEGDELVIERTGCRYNGTWTVRKHFQYEGLHTYFIDADFLSSSFKEHPNYPQFKLGEASNMSGPSLKCMPVESYYGRGPPEGGTAVQLVEPLPGVEEGDELVISENDF